MFIWSVIHPISTCHCTRLKKLSLITTAALEPQILLELVIPPTTGCDEVVPGSIPGLAYSFLFLQISYPVLRPPGSASYHQSEFA